MKRIAEVISKQRNAVVGDFGRNPSGHGPFAPLTVFWLTNMEQPRLLSEPNDHVRNQNELLEVSFNDIIGQMGDFHLQRYLTDLSIMAYFIGTGHWYATPNSRQITEALKTPRCRKYHLNTALLKYYASKRFKTNIIHIYALNSYVSKIENYLF